MTVSLIASKLPVPLRFAVRELRGGLSGFRVFLACLILGVAAIAAVGSLTRAIQEGMLAEGQALLGGDVEISLFQQQSTVDELAFFKASGDVSASSRLRSRKPRTASRAAMLERCRPLRIAFSAASCSIPTTSRYTGNPPRTVFRSARSSCRPGGISCAAA